MRLREKGIWLLDTMVFGWYLQQSIEYTQSKVSDEVVKKPKNRPPQNTKHSALVLSWELWTKHLVQAAAKDGNLKCIMPIGRNVGTAIMKWRMEKAIKVKGGSAVVEINPPCTKQSKKRWV